jgi:hypothetical protein
MSGHTDWKARGAGVYSGDALVCFVAGDDTTCEEDESNALLISLAPTAPHGCAIPGCPGAENKRKLEAFDEMVEALHALEDLIIETGYLSTRGMHQRLREIIAKAEGR